MISATEENPDWIFNYDSSIPLKSQVICESERGYIIAVVKQFTDGLYFGSNFFEINTNDKTLYCHFKCKDRGLTEDVADDKESFVRFFSSLDWRPSEYKNFETRFQYTLYDNFKLYYCYDNGVYKHALIQKDNSFFKGCYNKLPLKDDLEDFCTDFNKSFSNVITRENVAYNMINIFHKTEVNND